MKSKKLMKLVYVEEIFTDIRDVRAFELLLRRAIWPENFEVMKKKNRQEWRVMFWATPKQIRTLRYKFLEWKGAQWDEEYVDLLEER